MNPEEINFIASLGQKVFCFRPQDKEIKSYMGFILGISINAGGIIQYTIKSAAAGEVGGTSATIAVTEEELNEKIAKFKEYLDKQQKLGEAFFGDPEFNLQELIASVTPESAEPKPIEPK